MRYCRVLFSTKTSKFNINPFQIATSQVRNSCQDPARKQAFMQEKECQHRLFLFPFGLDRANAEKRAAANAPPKSQLKAMAEGNKFKCPKCMVWKCCKGNVLGRRFRFTNTLPLLIAYDRQLQANRTAYGGQAPQGTSAIRGII